MRARFDDTMTTSNTLIRDEYRAMATARRLQEHNEWVPRHSHEIPLMSIVNYSNYCSK
jgi:hypothetical protein